MNDEDEGIIKRGPREGTANKGRTPYWRALLGDFVEELIEEAHRDIEMEREGTNQ